MADDEVTLRPVTLDDAGWLAEMRVNPDAVGPHNYSGETDADATASDLRRQIPYVINTGLVGWLVVELVRPNCPAIPIGDVSWRTERWGPTPESACACIGIALLPEFRSKGYGTRAQRALVDLLFREFGAHRVQADTAADNPSEQRSLERVGFQREGLVRQAEHRDGTYHDHVLYGILRQEWDALR